MKSTKVLSGMLMGAALGVAAGMFLNSPKGKKVQRDIKKTAADFYSNLSSKMKTMKDVSEKKYKILVKDTMAKFEKAKKLTKAEAQELKKHADASWKHIKHLQKVV